MSPEPTQPWEGTPDRSAVQGSGSDGGSVTPPHSPAIKARDAAADLIGDVIGEYKLLDKIGEGGFGSVWLAERRGAIVQRVALKVIKPGMDTKGVVARFEQERQALALMDHPAVARVFDAGATDKGRPYFAMEYVAGPPIAEFCARRGTTLADRLELFSQACEGVQHAHERGIVHRDIKPSNILVSEHDGRMQAKVIDFGIAKALSGPLTDKTLVTREGNALGTPLYMSPEQNAGEVSRLGPASDVYALGVTLFELVTGRLPWAVPEGKDDDAEYLRRLVQAVEPARLRSVIRVGEGGMDGETARDLETIVLRAMDPDPTSRYATARALAEDVRRSLRGEAILARRDSPAYTAQRRVRRALRANRPMAMLSAWVAGFAAACLLITALWLWTPLTAKFDAMFRPSAGGSFEHVRVLVLGDDTAADLASLAGVEGPPEGDGTGMRRVHGEVLKRLAALGPSCVLVDINFKGASPANDGALVDGVRAMQHAGVPVVMASRRWWFGESASSDLSPALTAEAWPVFGGITTSNYVDNIDAAYSRDGAAWLPHAAVAAFAASRHPGAEFDLALDEKRDALLVTYWEREPGPRAGRRALGEPDIIPLSGAGTKPADDERCNVQKGDIAALFAAPLPSDADLGLSTWTVKMFLSATPGDQRRLVQGRVVVIGDPARDTVTASDGRKVAGPHVMGAAVERLLRGHAQRLPGRMLQVSFLGVGVLIGAWLAPRYAGLRLLGALAAGSVFAALLSIFMYSVARTQVSPLLCLVGLLCGCAAGKALVQPKEVRGA